MLAESKKKIQAQKKIEEEKNIRQSQMLKKFDLPLSNFERIVKDKSGGLSLYVNSGNIRAPQDGEVLYTGKLSTYGNVIVIKHKNEYQSVILGEIISSVHKNNLSKRESIGKIVKIMAMKKDSIMS